MRNRARLLFVLVSFFLSLSLWGRHITVSPFPLIDKLPSNSVQRILQDRDGFFWFGTTDGLCRYDAYRLQVFRSDLNNPTLLSDNEITCLAEDNRDRIWIGTRKGLNLLDRESLQITRFPDKQIAGSDIRSVLVASDGTIWVGVDNTICRYKADLTLLRRYVASAGEENPLPLAGINSIYEDSGGDIWITIWGAGLHKYNKKEDRFIHFPFVGKKNNPFKVFQDKHKQYWICTWGDGLYRFNPNGNKENMYLKQDVYDKARKQYEDTFFGLVEDDSFGYLWVMSFSGIYALSYNNPGDIKQVDISYLFKETNNLFSEIIKAQDGNLWIGAFDEGPLTIQFNKPEIVNFPLKSIHDRIGVVPNITSIEEDGDGTMWLSQNRVGIFLYNPSTQWTKTLKEEPSVGSISGFSNISSIKRIKSLDEIWVGLKHEPMVYALKKAKGKTSVQISQKIDLTSLNPNPGNPVEIYEDSKNNIWIITDKGVFFKPYTKDTKIYQVDPEIGGAADIAEDAKGSIWIASENKGVFMIPLSYQTNLPDSKIMNYRKSTGTFISDNTQAICADLGGDIWIGTKEGNIVRYRSSDRKFEDYTLSCELNGDAILNLQVDDYNHIWISTNKRIIEYNPVNAASRVYSSGDGLLVNSFIKGAVFKSKHYLFFGGNRGVTALIPSDMLTKTAPASKVLISDVKIQNRSVFSDSVNHRFNTLSQRLTLYPRDRNIEIDFTSFNYSFPDKIKYAYKMEGMDEDWIYTTGDRQFATYNQLKKGYNTFLVKATDENSVWSGEVTRLTIYKYPELYETWWAYLIYVCLFLMACYFAFRVTRNRIKLRNELKIAQIEKEKSEELTQTKLRYFTNISHDFLTPLTIISCLIDDVEAVFKKKISQYDVMRSNVDRLKRLLQQILDFRKIESGNMKLKITEGDISSFIQKICYESFMPLIDKKQISFSFVSTPSNIQAFFDMDKIDKIVFNLMSNAVKYTPDQGRIAVTLQAYAKDGYSFITIRVRDTGTGINPKDLDNIFKRFYYNKNTDAGKTNGIGLSLTRDLVELHHGTILAESKEGEGATFTVHVPIDKALFNQEELEHVPPYITEEVIMPSPSLSEVEEDLSEPENPIEEEPEIKEEATLLVVEDNEDLLRTIASILSKRYHILTATNGLMALELVKNNNIDIVISDVMMPVMDGLELCKTLKDNIETSHISVLLLTAKNSVHDRVECYNAGADSYISKPFDLRVLEARISNFVMHRKIRQQEFKSNVELNVAVLEYTSADEQFLTNAIQLIEKNITDSDFDVNTFADNLNMSKSSLYRKIKTMTGLSPIEFIRNIRLKHACKMLSDKSVSIAEVAYSVGFSDPKYFASCFKSEFNITPSEYQKTAKS